MSAAQARSDLGGGQAHARTILCTRARHNNADPETDRNLPRTQEHEGTPCEKYKDEDDKEHEDTSESEQAEDDTYEAEHAYEGDKEDEE